MQLIQPLTAGIRGAENGTATLYQIGTTTPATYYTDHDGRTAVTSGTISLDENGGGVAYVNQWVDVVVQDSGGTTVRTFTAGEAAANVEYRGASFTGTDRVSGAIAAGNPVDVQTVLDLVKTSFGATNFNVLVNATSKTLQSAIASSVQFFNVQDPTYGAVGDGVTDDSSAIDAAITAAEAVSGIVYFPQGTYLIGTALSFNDNITLLGCGPYASVLNFNFTSGAACLSVADAGVDITDAATVARKASAGRMLGLHLKNDAGGGTATIAIVAVATGARLHIEDVFIDGKNHSTLIVDVANGAELNALRMNILIQSFAGAATAAVDTGSATAPSRVFLTECTFTVGQSAFSDVIIKAQGTYITNCYFDVATPSSGTGDCIQNAAATGGQDAIVTGCRFVAGGGATIYAMDFGLASADGVFESGNLFSSVTAYKTSFTAHRAGVTISSRQCRHAKDTGGSGAPATVTIAAMSNGVCTIERTAGGAVQVDADGMIQGGLLTVLIDNNGSGGAITFTFNSAYFLGAATAGLAVNNNTRGIVQFVGAQVPSVGASSTRWVQVAAAVLSF